MSKIDKIKNYLFGISFDYGLYGVKYKLYDTQSNYARVKYGKEKFLERKLKRLIKKYNNYEKYNDLEINNVNKKHLDKFPIWICWFQGEENAPDIVKCCINSARENIPNDSEIHIITFKNIENYIEIPRNIKEKVDSGKISYTLFSDFIRVALLAKYGGFWIDSTVLITSDISNLCNYEYYTKKSDRIELNFGNYLLQGRFTIHLLKIDNNEVLINFLYDAMILYYKKYKIPVDYFMTNLFVDIAYNNIPKVKSMMDKLAINDRGLEARLCENINEEYNAREFKIYCDNMPFQKLTYKLNEYYETKNNKETFYGYIKKRYLGNGYSNE